MNIRISWSGGKDSTTAAILHLNDGDSVALVHYIPMFTKDIPLISKKHFNFLETSIARFTTMGAQYYRAVGITYYDYVLKRATRGPAKGRIFGFPIVGYCGFKRDSKIQALSSVNISNTILDIGYTIDEPSRTVSVPYMSILRDRGYTQKMTYDFCGHMDFLSPSYETRRRDGCALCFNASDNEIREWLMDYPDAIPFLHELQEVVKKERPERPLRRGYSYFNLEGFYDKKTLY